MRLSYRYRSRVSLVCELCGQHIPAILRGSEVSQVAAVERLLDPLLVF
jgi:hypothetical protein